MDAFPAPALLRRAAAACTSPAVQRAVARLLGAPAETADAAVTALGDAGALSHGVTLMAVLVAARRGTDLRGALARLADGDTPPEQWSDYEARAAAEEAEEEARRALRALDVPRDRDHVVDLLAPEAPTRLVEGLVVGAGAALGGPVAAHERHGTPLLRALVDHSWCRGLLGRVGVPLQPALPDGPALRELQALLDGAEPPGSLDAGLRTVAEPAADALLVRCAPGYLDPFVSSARA